MGVRRTRDGRPIHIGRCSAGLRLGADTPKRKRAVDRLHIAFHSGRILGLTSAVLDEAGRVFRAMYGNAFGLPDRLGPINDLLIARTAKEIGAAVVTGNVLEFRRIAGNVRGLRIVAV